MRAYRTSHDGFAVPSFLLQACEQIRHGQDRMVLFLVGAIIVCGGAVAAGWNAIPAAPAAVCICLGVLAGALLYAAAARSSAAKLEKVAIETLEQAEKDELTQVYKRSAFLSRLDLALEKHTKAEEVAIAFFEIDRFKQVNDIHGHDAGDALLLAIATRIGRLANRADVLARLGGDEFVVMACGNGAYARMRRLTADVFEGFKHAFTVDGRTIQISLSAGISASEAKITRSEMMRRADVAMFQAKRENGEGFLCYAPAMDRDRSIRRELERRLRRAIDADQLKVFYQPIFQVETGRLVGTEALLRWPQPGGKLVPPAKFIPVAEDSGLIHELGAWTLRQALRQTGEWGELPVWVNVSPTQLRTPGFAKMVGECLKESGVRPDLLRLEITESVLITHPESAAAAINELQELGVSLALDDFGSGFSSLSHLRSFKFDVVKIDRNFVWAPHEEPGAGELLKAVVDFAHGLDIKVVMERVETEKQVDIVEMLGCDLIQGFHVGAPVGAAAFTERFLPKRSIDADPKVWVA